MRTYEQLFIRGHGVSPAGGVAIEVKLPGREEIAAHTPDATASVDHVLADRPADLWRGRAAAVDAGKSRPPAHRAGAGRSDRLRATRKRRVPRHRTRLAKGSQITASAWPAGHPHGRRGRGSAPGMRRLAHGERPRAAPRWRTPEHARGRASAPPTVDYVRSPARGAL